MTTETLDRLLTTLAVHLHAFAVCEIETGWRLVIDGMNQITIHYVLAGEGTLRTETGSEVPFQARNIIVVPAGQKQSLGAATGILGEGAASDNCVMLADGLVQLTAGNGRGGVTCVCGAITASYAGALGLFERIRRPIVVPTLLDDPLRAHFDLMLQELARPGLGTRALTEALMKVCLVTLLRRHLKSSGSDSDLFAELSDRRLALAVTAIVDEPAGAHTVASLAEVAGMSRTAFAERFSATFGRSPIDFVQAVRLRHAAHLLRTTDVPIKAIAGAVGYRSRSQFSRAFRSSYELDPTTFRQSSSAAREEDLQILVSTSTPP